ncbi:MAG: substrate-binding domain-containing protein [Desulfobacterales bacterium]|nr:substrate-binding domain-containing protein [Desulfobacterales bacterium]
MSKAAYKRRDSVLKIIVSEYIATATPVASEAILRHHSLGVSPATIRNDMASLEALTVIDHEYVYQERNADGPGKNKIKESVSGDQYSITNTVDSSGKMSSSSTTVASSDIGAVNTDTDLYGQFGSIGMIANSKKVAPFKLTRKEVFLALAKEVPDPAGGEKLIPNPYKTWKDVNSSLPAIKIEVLGPPPTSGTRDAFVELAMEGGAKKIDWIKAVGEKDEKQFKAIAHTIREDGAFIEAGENDNLIVQKLEANPNALGIFGFSFLDQNMDKIQGSVVDDVEPTFENISSGTYPVSRSLYIYVKKAHVDSIPGIKEYLKEFSSEKAWGGDGYLPEKGMIPMPDDERKKYQKIVEELKILSCEDLK